MAGKPKPADVLAADFAGMTKSQLYDIMSQMKTLIEQNRQQAREILIQNPPLTKALFQAQIMLGMVQPPPVIPAIQPTVSQQPPQSVPASQAPNIPKPQPVSSQGLHQNRKHHQNQPAGPISSSVPPVNLPSQSAPMPKGHVNAQVTGMQTSHIPSNMPPQPHQPQLAPSQLQLPPSGISHVLPQPPMLAQPRPPHSMSGFHNQYQQMGSNSGFQHGGGHQHPSQSMFHSGNRTQHPGPSYPQGQQPVPSQPPPQSLYQGGGSHLTSDFNQGSTSMQVDRGSSSSWPPGLPDSSTMGQAPANQPARSAALSPDMEKALLQQVMSLTPEQINLLPQEQRNQVLQLQQMLRQ